MKQTVYRYGLYSVITVLVLSAINLFILDKVLDFAAQEIAGYLTILLAMIFVFFGIKQYRDHFNNGYLSFGQGLKLGLLMVLIPSLAFGLFDLLYTQVLNPGWADTYYNYEKQQLIQSTAPDKLAGRLKEMKGQKELWSSPVFEFGLMFLTVFVIGFLVTIISSLSLMRKRKTVFA
jgi:Protein of unknown function (DUF4199)